jgi:hypothetical protein
MTHLEWPGRQSFPVTDCHAARSIARYRDEYANQFRMCQANCHGSRKSLFSLGSSGFLTQPWRKANEERREPGEACLVVAVALTPTIRQSKSIQSRVEPFGLDGVLPILNHRSDDV